MARREQKTDIVQDPKYDLTVFNNEKTRLENEMISLGETNNRIKKDIEDKQLEIESKNKTIKQLDLDIDEGTIKYADIVGQINMVTKTHAMFVSNLEDKKKEFDDYIKHVGITKNTIESTRLNEKTSYEAIIKMLENDIDDLNTNFNGKQTILDNINISIDSKNNLLIDLDSKLGDKSNEILKLDSLISHKKEELSNFEDITAKLKLLNREFNLVVDDIETSKKDLESIKEEKQNVIVDIENKKKELEEKTKSYDNAVLVAEDRIAKLKHQYNKAEAEKIINSKLN